MTKTEEECLCVVRYTDDTIVKIGDYVAFGIARAEDSNNSETIVSVSVMFGWVYGKHEWQVSIRDIDNRIWVVRPTAIAKVKDK
jgi:hypothetical protein